MINILSGLDWRVVGATGSPGSVRAVLHAARTVCSSSAVPSRSVTDFPPLRSSRLPCGHYGRSDDRAMAVLAPGSSGVCRADTPMFAGLLLGAALIVGPAVSLERIDEQLSDGRSF